MNRTLYLFIISILLSLFVLSACGGDSGRQQASEDSGSAAQAAENSSSEGLEGDPEAGKEKFTNTCAACHGAQGEGVQGLGKDMTTSEFIASKSDQELVEFIKQGRDPSDPANTTGVAMPPKGGNPSLADQDLYNIVAYIRTLQK